MPRKSGYGDCKQWQRESYVRGRDTFGRFQHSMAQNLERERKLAFNIDKEKKREKGVFLLTTFAEEGRD